MNSIRQDLQFALRQLSRSPGFALTTILTLALGIGSAAAVFSVIDAVLLRPLPFANQDRLVVPNTTANAGYTQPWSYPSYLDGAALSKTLDVFAGYSDFFKINLETPTGPVSLPAVKGTANFFNVFGEKPLLGRTFLPGEDQPGRDNIAVLSYEVWQRNFGGQPGIIGQAARLDGVPYTIIGVMPAGFRFPLSARNAVYTPLHADPRWRDNRGTHWMRTVALLKPGVTRAQAQADFTRVLADLGRAYPDTDTGRKAALTSLQKDITGTSDAPLKTLLFAVLALLAIACVNVAGLLLARGVKREREVALRAALGAGRKRLIRQMITESLVLSLAGLVGGILISWALLAALRTFLVSALDRGADVHMNVTVLLVALLLSTLTSVAASLAPALRLSGVNPNRALRAGGAAGTGRGQHRLRSAFVITQVGLSLVLLVLSGVLLRNLHNLLNTDLGFNPARVLYTQINLSLGRYQGRDPLVSFYKPFLERVSALPGIQAAGFISTLPIQAAGNNSDIHITGQPPYPPQQEMLAEGRIVSPGYFDVMGIKLERGRMLSAALDTPDNPSSSVVVNQAFNRKFFSNGGDPIGAHIDDSDQADHKTGIVGLTADIRQKVGIPPLAERDWIMDQIEPKDRLENFNNMFLVVRSESAAQQLAPAIRKAMHEVDPTVPFMAFESMETVISDSLVFERMENWLFGIFAAFALLLAVVGLYGLTSHEVELRTREIGVRMALGSTRGRVVRQVLLRVAALMAGGIALGWLLTLALRRVLASVVELHAGHDALLLTGLTLGLALIGIIASLLPARRAASIDPMQALRTE